jgi:hypothetical protein
MDVDTVWRIERRGGPIITGPIRSGVCRVGDVLVLTDEHGTATASVLGLEFHVRPGECGLLLGDVNGELRQGQIAHVRGA